MDLKKVFPLSINQEDEGTRLDKFLSEKFPEVSRSRWTKILDQGWLLLNGVAAKPSVRLKSGQILNLLLDDNEEMGQIKKLSQLNSNELSNVVYKGPEPEILYEDDDLLVLDKPLGVAVHAGAGIPMEETLVAWLLEKGRINFNANAEELLHWGEDLLEQERPGIVHRLDKGTSGCLAVAKNPESHRKLSEQFASKEAGRHYWACVKGDVNLLKTKPSPKLQKILEENRRNVAFRISKDGKFSFSSPIGRDPNNRLRMTVLAEGAKQALTHFQVLEISEKGTWLDVSLDTGRTHQIRVHLSFLGYPIVGDRLYGGPENDRIYLHAHTLFLRQPKTGVLISAKSKLSFEVLNEQLQNFKAE